MNQDDPLPDSPLDPWVDASLEEILGQQSPPDLTERIMARLRAAAESAPRAESDLTPSWEMTTPDATLAGTPITEPHAQELAAQGSRIPPTSARRAVRSEEQALASEGDTTVEHPTLIPSFRTAWGPVLATAVVLLIGVGVAMLISQIGLDPPAGGTVAQNNQSPADPTSPGPSPPGGASGGSDRGAGSNGKSGAGSDRDKGSSSTEDPVDDLPPWEPSAPDIAKIIPSVPPVAERPIPAPWDATQLVARIDRGLQDVWQKQQVTAAANVTDAEWLNRVWQALGGDTLTMEEEAYWITSLANSSRAEVIDQMLAPPYAERWQRHWANLLTQSWLSEPLAPADGNSAENTTAGSSAADPALAVARRQLNEFVVESFRRGAGLDEITRQLIAADGSNDPNSADFHPAVAFWVHADSQGTTVVTDRICRALLGTRLDCARCHDHPVGSWPQDAYWQLDAHLSHVQLSRLSSSSVGVVDDNAAQPAGSALASRDGNSAAGQDQVPFWRITTSDRSVTGNDVAGNEVGANESPKYGNFFRRPDERIGFAQPAWPFADPPVGSVSNPQSLPAPADVRRVLAERVVKSQQFSQAMANRIWSGVWGTGLVSPVDDLGPHQHSPNQDLLNLLADQLAAHRFNLPSTLKSYLLAEALNVGSADQPVMSDDLVVFHEYPQPPLALPTAGATLHLLAELTRARLSPAQLESQLQPLLAQQNSAEGTGNTSDAEKARQNARSQQELARVLEWVQDRAVNPQLNETDEAFLLRLTRRTLTNDQLIEHAFQQWLRRLPTESEWSAARSLLSGDSRDTGLRRLWTALRSVPEAARQR